MSTITLDETLLDRAQHKTFAVDRHRTQHERFGAVRVEPYSPAVGAVVSGLRIDGKAPVEAGLREFLLNRLAHSGFLSFEPGTVSAENYVHLVALFGHAEYTGTPYTPIAEESTKVNTIDSKIKKTKMNQIWHIDQAFRNGPPRFTMLFGKTVPPSGGDTLFANAAAAYDLLDPQFADYLETLTAIHDVETQGFLTLAYRDPGELQAQRAKNPPIEAPLIRTHPETGKKTIYVNELYTQRILGVSRTVSAALLSILFEQIKSPEVQSRYRWEEGAVLIWDNRVVQHRGVGDYGDGHRVLLRAIVK